MNEHRNSKAEVAETESASDRASLKLTVPRISVATRGVSCSSLSQGAAPALAALKRRSGLDVYRAAHLFPSSATAPARSTIQARRWHSRSAPDTGNGLTRKGAFLSLIQSPALAI
eukprot:103425-Pleurochrysis_carterae.AAC.2